MVCVVSIEIVLGSVVLFQVLYKRKFSPTTDLDPTLARQSMLRLSYNRKGSLSQCKLDCKPYLVQIATMLNFRILVGLGHLIKTLI